MFRITIFLLFLSVCFNAPAQKPTVEKQLQKYSEQFARAESSENRRKALAVFNEHVLKGISSGKSTDLLPYLTKVYEHSTDQWKQYPIQYADLNYLLGLCYTNLGEYVSALPFCELSESLVEKQSPQDTVKRMKRKIILSHLYASTEQIHKAIEINEEGLALASAQGDPMMLFRFLMNGGNAYQYKGETALSIGYFKRAYEIIESANNNPYFLQAVKTNMGASYISSDRPELAKAELLDALTIAKEGNRNATGEVYDDLSTVILFDDLSKVYTDLERYDSALYFANKTIEGINRVFPEGHAYYGEFLLNLGIVYKHKGNYKKAREILEESIEINHKYRGTKNIFSASGYAVLADIEMESMQTAQAQKLYQEALEAIYLDYESGSPHNKPSLEDQCLSPKEAIKILHKKARAYMTEYRAHKDTASLQRAYENYIITSQFIAGFKANLNEVKSRLLFSSNFKQVYEQAIHVAYTLYNTHGRNSYLEQALNWMEDNKGNELFTALNLSLLKQHKNDSLFDMEADLKATISFYESKRASLWGKGDSLELQDYNSSLFSKRRELDKVISALQSKYPDYYAAKYGNQHISLENLANSILQDGQAVLSYFMGGENTYLITLSGDKFDFKMIGQSRELSKQMSLFGEKVKSRSADIDDEANWLYSHLIPEVLKERQIAQLVIIPDGVLNFLSFEALKSVDRPQKFLINEFAVTYSPSINFLLHQRPSQPISSALIYAPEFVASETETRGGNALAALPNARHEAQNIAGLFDTEPLLGNVATETHFKSHGKQMGLIHLATHAMVDPSDPKFSRLAFSIEGDSLNDGFLHLYELYNLQLQAEMVSLSACNTGEGQYYEGEGVMSLARGFMYAGVPNVMMSLWSVPDQSTSTIMQSFYGYLKEGMSKPEALRKAKLDYLSTADANTAAPYFWSGFVFIGKPEVGQPKNDSYIYAGAGGILLLIGAAYFYSRRRNGRS
ncbi:CHAT domain-containing protein [Fulvivirga kasyanovii]|uniref:CHAT domain-containing protein n=1 Tax=Fulvivirga kasyanovii TaxID=396812 RepID=A0ABW9RUN4_9BACT|nr:CHAT domain-containing protein [Fulvivirga kasyanovii]MTI27402.1 CHAT domain-containing protein [Fulvivirga kasyanovii]